MINMEGIRIPSGKSFIDKKHKGCAEKQKQYSYEPQFLAFGKAVDFRFIGLRESS